MAEEWEEYSPPWAQHVKGRHTKQVRDEDGIPEEQKVEAICEFCKAVFKRTCSSGLVKQHISRFATVHLHRHPLAPIPPTKPAA